MNKIQELVTEVFTWTVVILTFTIICGGLLLAALYIIDAISEFI